MSSTLLAVRQRQIHAALRVANVIGTLKQVIAALVLSVGGLVVLVMLVAAFMQQDVAGLVAAGITAALLGLVLATYWAMFGWFEHVLRLLAQIAQDR